MAFCVFMIKLIINYINFILRCKQREGLFVSLISAVCFIKNSQ